MSPDPSHQSDERRFSGEGTYAAPAVVNTENDDDDISYEGYEVLPQDYNESNVESEYLDQDSNSDEENAGNNTTTNPSSTFDRAFKIELSELWNSTSVERVANIDMDSTKEEQIKNAMAGFKLPTSSIPSWAMNIPEDQWKQQILNRINSSAKD